MGLIMYVCMRGCAWVCVGALSLFFCLSRQVMGYLKATPDRMCAAEVCQPWAEGARHKAFKLRVSQAG